MLLVTIIIFIGAAISVESSSLNVTVYYESLCPDSKRFITTQLYPVYQQIPEYLNVEFVPYGAAEVKTAPDGAKFFVCQHGPNECYGNEIQACAIVVNKKKSINFIDCAMGSDDASDDTNLIKCALLNGISWDIVEYCMETGTGAQLFIMNGRLTDLLDPPLSFVPTIIFNGVYDSDLEDAAQTDFLATVCQLLNGEPIICNQNNN